MDMLELLKYLSGVASSVMILVAFILAVFKPVRTWTCSKVKTVVNADETARKIAEMSDAITEIKEALEEQARASAVRDRATASIIRNEITKIYYTYLDKKAFPAREKENILKLSESYANLNGNTYVEAIVKEMLRWDTY